MRINYIWTTFVTDKTNLKCTKKNTHMYRKSLVIKRHKDEINRLNNKASELLRQLGSEKDYNTYKLILKEYNSTLAKVYIIRRKVDNLQNGFPELGRSIDAFDSDKNNNNYEE